MQHTEGTQSACIHTERTQNAYRVHAEHREYIECTQSTYIECTQNAYRVHAEHREHTECTQSTYIEHTEHIHTEYMQNTESIQSTHRAHTYYREHTEIPAPSTPPAKRISFKNKLCLRNVSFVLILKLRLSQF